MTEEAIKPEELDQRASFHWNMENNVQVRAFETHEVSEEGLPIWEFWIAHDMLSVHIANAAATSDDPKFQEYAQLTYQEGLQTIYVITQVLDATFAQDQGCGCGGECGDGCDCGGDCGDPACGCGGAE